MVTIVMYAVPLIIVIMLKNVFYKSYYPPSSTPPPPTHTHTHTHNCKTLLGKAGKGKGKMEKAAMIQHFPENMEHWL